MYCIKLDDDRELVTTIKEPIYRGDNLHQKIMFLIPKVLEGIETEKSVVYFNCIKSDETPDVIVMERDTEEYNKRFWKYLLPVNKSLSQHSGDVYIWLHFCSDADGSDIVMKTGECILEILESKSIDEYIDDKSITALNQLKKDVEDLKGFADAKADNIVFHPETSTIQLMANGKPIGDQIEVAPKADKSIVDVRISDAGKLVATFEDGTTKDLGNVVGKDGAVYVPHIDAHNVLTFTIEEKPGAIPPPVDLVQGDNWGDIDQQNPDGKWGDVTTGEPMKTEYVWETL